MSCGLTKLADQQERPQRGRVAGRAAGVAIVEPGDDTVGDQRVAAHPGVGERAPCGSGPTQPANPNGSSGSAGEVPLHRGGIDVAVVVVGGDDLAVGVGEVGVADVPLAVVVRVVAGGTEPVAERGHLALGQPAQPRVVGHLAEPVGLGDAVDVRVVAGEHRRPARHAGERAGVVPLEATRRGRSNHRRPVSVSSRHAGSSSDSYGGAARSSSVMMTITSGRGWLMSVSPSVGGGQCSKVVGEAGDHLVGRLGRSLPDESGDELLRWARSAVDVGGQRHDRVIAVRRIGEQPPFVDSGLHHRRQTAQVVRQTHRRLPDGDPLDEHDAPGLHAAGPADHLAAIDTAITVGSGRLVERHEWSTLSAQTARRSKSASTSHTG